MVEGEGPVHILDRPSNWITGWDLWSVPRHVLTYVLVIEGLALGVTAATAPRIGVTGLDLMRFGLLGACAVVHVELTRGVERMRHITGGAGPYLDTKSGWSFAALLILPPALASAMVVFTHTYSWMRVWRGRRPLYRWIFTIATVLIATQAGVVVLAFGPGPYPGIPSNAIGLGVVAAAGTLRWLINYVLVVGAIMISSPDMRASQALSNFSERILEAGACGLGIAAAGLVVLRPILLAGVVLGLLAMHRGVLLPQFRRAACVDGKTGLSTASWWHEVAQRAFDRATSQKTALAVLVLDLDYLKQVNDTHGHLAGDHVLHTVATAISGEIRGYDTAGRWGGDEFAVLVPGVEPTDLLAMAERICRRVHALVITIPGTTPPTVVQDLSASIGVASFPVPGITTLEDLLRAADANLYMAKNTGRNKVVA
jgi:diguanylate cyclase (GGDEF)-like protein